MTSMSTTLKQAAEAVASQAVDSATFRPVNSAAISAMRSPVSSAVLSAVRISVHWPVDSAVIGALDLASGPRTYR